MSGSATATAVLSAMITPAVLISAAGTLVLSTAQRLARVVDRARVLVAKVEEFQQPAAHAPLREAERKLINDQVVRLSERMRLLSAAMTGLYTAIGLFVATSIAIGVVTLLQVQYDWVPVVSELAGTVALLYGSVLLVREARQAVSTTLQELAFMRESVLEHNPHGGAR